MEIYYQLLMLNRKKTHDLLFWTTLYISCCRARPLCKNGSGEDICANKQNSNENNNYIAVGRKLFHCQTSPTYIHRSLCRMRAITFSSCVTRLFSESRLLQVRPSKEEPSGIAGARLFTGQVPSYCPTNNVNIEGIHRRIRKWHQNYVYIL